MGDRRNMGQMMALKKVMLNERHLCAEQARRGLPDRQEKKSIPAHISLVIAQFPSDSGYFLLYQCEDGQTADTWHPSLEDALHQAEIEFEVRSEEWIEIG